MLHGWDESKQMAWADPKTGLSPEVWSRAMGWYAMALVDVLDWFPKEHPQRSELVAALNRTAEAIVHYQDKKSGVWWQVMDKGGKAGTSKRLQLVACMFMHWRRVHGWVTWRRVMRSRLDAAGKGFRRSL